MRTNRLDVLRKAPRGSVVSAHRLLGGAATKSLFSCLALLGAAAPSLADESIGGATTVVNLVSGLLPSGNNVNVVQGDAVFQDEGVRTDADEFRQVDLARQH